MKCAQFVALCSRDEDFCEQDREQIGAMRIDLGLIKKEAEIANKHNMEEIKHLNFCKNCGHKIN